MKFLLNALLAATALLPLTTVAAQEAPRQRGERGEGRRGDRMVDRAAGPARADISVRRDDDRVETRADAVPRQDRSVRRDANRAAIQTRVDARAAWRGNADRQEVRRDDRRDDRTVVVQRGRGGDRNDNGWRNDDRNDRGAYAQRDRRNDNARRDNDRGAWNRGWRGDRRYDYGNDRAANRGAYRLPRYYAPYGWNGGYRRFSVGFTLNAGLFGQNYWIGDPYAYRLPAAYGPYRWVRYYNDALLVDVRYGQVVDVVHDIFW